MKIGGDIRLRAENCPILEGQNGLLSHPLDIEFGAHEGGVRGARPQPLAKKR